MPPVDLQNPSLVSFTSADQLLFVWGGGGADQKNRGVSGEGKAELEGLPHPQSAAPQSPKSSAAMTPLGREVEVFKNLCFYS